ncbi:MAG: hypothetical protein KC731_00740 [Myxococcales bacterium]|nr:hypothetical protein [Myxococcales bacterium]
MEIRPGEGRDAAAAFLSLFTFMAAHGMLETARDALFLSRLPAVRLPWVYLAIAAAGLAALWLARRASIRSDRRSLSTVLGVAAVGAAALALGAREEWAFVPYVIYVWVGVTATIVTAQLWQLLGDRFTIGQAKRLFGVIGAGGTLGVALGSMLAAFLAARLSSPGLVAVGAAILAVAALPPLLLSRRQQDGAQRDEASEPPYRIMREEPHAQRLLYLALAATITLTIADYLFKSMVAASVERSQLAAFLGTFYAAINVVGLLVQVGLTAWILRSIGAVRGLAILPAAVLVGAAVFAALPVLAAIMVVKAVDEALRHSLQRSAFEVLFLPLPSRARHALKGVMEVVGQRGGQALASVAILVAVSAGAGPRSLAVALGLLACLWLLGLVGASRRYLDLFRRRLRAGMPDLPTGLPELDLAALEVALVSLNSADERETLSALALLEQQDRTALIPPLLMYHPSRRVSLAVLDALARSGRRDIEPFLERLLESDDAERRVAALLSLHSVAPQRGVLDAYLEDDDPRLRTAALVALARQPRRADEMMRRAAEVVSGADAALKRALAQAIAVDPEDRWVPTLVALADCGDDVARSEVAKAALVLGKDELVLPLIGMLARRRVRDAARDALFAYGDRAIDQLGQALSNPQVSLAARRQIPLTLARFASEAVARLLLDELVGGRDGMTRYKSLRALGAVLATDPTVTIDVRRVGSLARATLGRVVALMRTRLAIGHHAAKSSPSGHVLVALLKEKERHAIERLFRLLGLMNPSQDLALIYSGLLRADPKERAASREILAHTLDRELRTAILVLVDDLDDADKLSRLPGGQPALTEDDAVRRLATDHSEAIRLIAGHHLAELRGPAKGASVAFS